MAIGQKLTIFFVLTIVLHVKSATNASLDFKPGFHPHAQNKIDIEESYRNRQVPESLEQQLLSTTSTTKKTPQAPIYPPPHPTMYYPICNPHQLHIFSFSNVGLQKIGRDFISGNNVIKLSLDNNNISEISLFAFRKVRNLKHLDLAGNNIPKEKLLAMIGNDMLENLIIDNNRDFHSPKKNILDDYEVFPKLKYLHLSNSQLNNFQIPYSIATPSLTHLYINNNNINSSEVVFDNIPATLTHLYLNKNFITGIEQGKLRHLHELFMNENNITQICYEDCQEESISLKNAEHLQILSLTKNQISEISVDAFYDTHRLLILDLSNNKITNIHEDTFNEITKMKKLILAKNQLSAIPHICSMNELQILNLSGNRISAILYKTFCSRVMPLQYLYLADNIITTIANEAFYEFNNLKYLDLSGNQLKQLPERWMYSLTIQELHLERNNFSDLNSVPLTKVPNLNNVYLDENPMPILLAESFQSLPSHLKVHLKNVHVDQCAECPCNNDNEKENENEENNSKEFDDNDNEDY